MITINTDAGTVQFSEDAARRLAAKIYGDLWKQNLSNLCGDASHPTASTIKIEFFRADTGELFATINATRDGARKFAQDLADAVEISSAMQFIAQGRPPPRRVETRYVYRKA